MAPERPEPPSPPLQPQDVRFDELNRNAEAHWNLIGPDSGGGKTLYRYKGYLFTVGYGDWSSLPGGAEEVISIQPDTTPGFPPRGPMFDRHRDETSDFGGVTYQELRERAEGRWKLEGPWSKGGTDVYRYQGRLFIVGYGECSSLPDGAEAVIGVRADNTPGFPPSMDNGHAAGCTHSVPFESDSWGHRISLLMIHRGVVQLFQRAEEVWTCPIETWLEPGSEYQSKVLEVFGPAVLEEALRCAAGRLPSARVGAAGPRPR